MKPDDIAKFDQATAFIAESFPTMLGKFYANLKSEGFSEDQSFELICIYWHSINSKMISSSPEE